MGEIKLSPVWGYGLDSFCQPAFGEGEREGQVGAGVVRRCWIGNGFPTILQ